MQKKSAGVAVVLALFFGLIVIRFNVSARQAGPQGLQQALAENVKQVFTFTTSAAATFSNATGALEPIPSTSLVVSTQAPGLLTISFSARGSVEPSGSQIIPIVMLACRIDGQDCQPDSNTVEFLYPQFCCDTRSFQWVAKNVPAGLHTVELFWGMGNPTMAIMTNRTLIVETASRRERLDD